MLGWRWCSQVMLPMPNISQGFCIVSHASADAQAHAAKCSNCAKYCAHHLLQNLICRNH